MIWWPWLVVPAAYVLGSVSPAYWAGKCKGIDLRDHGSKNLGATNAGRVLGGKWFAIVFTLDVLKGVAAVLCAGAVASFAEFSPDQQQALRLVTAVAVVLGHNFTCFHGFKGGKAVATSLGVLIGLVPWVALYGFAVWFIVWAISTPNDVATALPPLKP